MNGRRGRVPEDRGNTRDDHERGRTSKGGASRARRKERKAKAERDWNQGTRRTPGSGAGRNKPAGRSTEETVKVERNHEDGTSEPFGKGEPKRKESGQPGNE
jgi:hypothetical protein